MSVFTYRNTKAAKLSVAQVMEIRERYAKGETQAALSRAFGVGTNQIGKIVRGEAWQQLPAHLMTKDELQESAERMFALQERLKREAAEKRERDTRGERMLGELSMSPTVLKMAEALGARPKRAVEAEEKPPREQRYDSAGYPMDDEEEG